VRRKRQIIIACSLVVIIIICIFFAVSGEQDTKTESVMIANREILRGQELTDDMFTIVQVSEGSFIKAFRKAEDGISGIVLRNVPDGDILLCEDVGDIEDMTRFPNLEPGKRSYSLMLKPEQANGCLLFENGRVDIYVHLSSSLAGSEPGAQLLEAIKANVHVVENVRIIKILDECGHEISPDSGNSRIICFELDPEDIKLISSGMRNGSITIAALSNE
jgi:Flp pilus assembly protein CpaB